MSETRAVVPVVPAVRLTRAGDGVYEAQDGRYEVQNPHAMYGPDPDRHWYVQDNVLPLPNTFGPFDTLREVRAWIAARTVDVRDD